jgi:S-adenosylmethionine synthetase
MFEKVNPAHPDKVADRIAGAIVDIAYETQIDPKVAVEVLIGHGVCHIVAETSTHLETAAVRRIVSRIAGETVALDYHETAQDPILAKNQARELRCGDNGIFRGVPVTEEQMQLVAMAKVLYEKYPYDGKFIMDGKRLIICQSNVEAEDIREIWPEAEVNPLGYWTGGTDVDTGATNRKLGSDMADSVTGGGLHGKDLSKADVAVNIYAWLKAQQAQVPVQFSCAIGDRMIDGIPYANVVQIAKHFIDWIGGFEKFAEWGLV